MREPLVLPATALFVGIWLGRAFDFSLSEAMWPVAAFLCLAFRAHGHLRRGCVLLALLMAGAFTEAWHRAGPPPYIEAGSRETVVLEKYTDTARRRHFIPSPALFIKQLFGSALGNVPVESQTAVYDQNP